jgi:uncharacterized protein YdeI (YjbR/CyaY-like superfamily)
MSTDERIDRYIAEAEPFARPILEHLRALVRRALPHADETIKWSMPHFTVKGRNIAGMAAFKAHAAFVIHGEGRQSGAPNDGMGQYSKVRTITDLPDDATLTARLQQVAVLVEAGAPVRAKPKQPKPEIEVPGDFAAALETSAKAKAFFAGLARSHRRDYLEWITGAKADATRSKRIADAVAWLGEGKKRNWKYEKC